MRSGHLILPGRRVESTHRIPVGPCLARISPRSTSRLPRRRHTRRRESRRRRPPGQPRRGFSERQSPRGLRASCGPEYLYSGSSTQARIGFIKHGFFYKACKDSGTAPHLGGSKRAYHSPWFVLPCGPRGFCLTNSKNSDSP